MQNIRSRFYAIGCLMAILILVSGCVATTGNFGRLVYNDNVTLNFEDFKVTPGYQYYYFGTKTFPKAVVGISNNFTLKSELWAPIKLTSKKLHSWIWVHANRNIKGYRDYGANITGSKGEHLGIWYSLKGVHQRARITLTNENIVQVGAPFNTQANKRFSILRI